MIWWVSPYHDILDHITESYEDVREHQRGNNILLSKDLWKIESTWLAFFSLLLIKIISTFDNIHAIEAVTLIS